MPDEQPYTHFVIPAKPDFFEVDLHLSDASKALFDKGAPGQGFVGLVDLETNLIHLFPAFNKDDGQLRLDKEGKKFAKLAETAQSLGGGAGDLHMRTAGALRLGDKAGNKQNLMGFGIWKGGQSVKFLAELPENNLRLISDEYLVVKDEKNQWKICYVDHDKKVTDVSLNEVQKAMLAKLPTDVAPEKMTFLQRKPIVDTLNITDPGTIKVIKNRSSSQNMFSCKYQPIYGEFFTNLMPRGHSGSHQVALQRELPLPVLSKIVNSVCEGLNISSQGNYLECSYLVPNEENDNRLRYHLEVESFWMRFQKILKALNAQTNENSQIIAKNFNQVSRVHWPESSVREFISSIELEVANNSFGIDIFLLIIKHQEYYGKIYKLSHYLTDILIEKHLQGTPGVKNEVLSIIENNLASHNEYEILTKIVDYLMQSVKKGDLKVTADNFKDIAEFLFRNISHTDAEKMSEYLNLLSKIKNENNIGAQIVDGFLQQSYSSILKELIIKAVNAPDATEYRKIVTLFENHGFKKNQGQIIMAHILKYYDDYKKFRSLNNLTGLVMDSADNDVYFELAMSAVLKALKEVNANEAYKVLIRDLLSQNPEVDFKILQIYKSNDWVALDEIIKEMLPKEHAVYAAIKNKLNISAEVYIDLGSESVRYLIDFDTNKRSMTLKINPPGVIDYGYDGAVTERDTRNFRESLAEVLAKLKDLGFPQHALDKVSSDISADLNVTSYQIDLDQATQLAIIERNQEKPAIEKGVVPEKSENRKSLLMSDKQRLPQDKENATPNQSGVEVSTGRRYKPENQ